VESTLKKPKKEGAIYPIKLLISSALIANKIKGFGVFLSCGK
jgi:hypothetical protein